MNFVQICKITWFHLSHVRTWLHGIAAALVGGSATTLGAHFTDPAHLDFSPEGMHAMWKVALAGGFVTALAYLVKSPLPSYCDPDKK